MYHMVIDCNALLKHTITCICIFINIQVNPLTVCHKVNACMNEQFVLLYVAIITDILTRYSFLLQTRLNFLNNSILLIHGGLKLMVVAIVDF